MYARTTQMKSKVLKQTVYHTVTVMSPTRSSVSSAAVPGDTSARGGVTLGVTYLAFIRFYKVIILQVNQHLMITAKATRSQGKQAMLLGG